jgi:hypothetical protein
MRYEVEVWASAGYIVTVEAENTFKAVEEAEERVRQQLGPAIWINFESQPLEIGSRDGV